MLKISGFPGRSNGAGYRRHHDLARLQLRPCAAPGPVSRPPPGQAPVPQAVRDRSPARQPLAAQPLEPVSRLPGRQPELRLHALEQPDLQRVRLAKPCYLLVDEGYADSFAALMTETDWDAYGTGRHPKCNDCMAHCGYEGTAVDATFRRPLAALKVALFGPRLDGPMAPELPAVVPPTEVAEVPSGARRSPPRCRPDLRTSLSARAQLRPGNGPAPSAGNSAGTGCS